MAVCQVGRKGQVNKRCWGNFSSEQCPRLTAYKTTIKDVRHYSIKMMNGFSTFKCPLCKHLVTTREFSSQNGNCRTQVTTLWADAARILGTHFTRNNSGSLRLHIWGQATIFHTHHE